MSIAKYHKTWTRSKLADALGCTERELDHFLSVTGLDGLFTKPTDSGSGGFVTEYGKRVICASFESHMNGFEWAKPVNEGE